MNGPLSELWTALAERLDPALADDQAVADFLARARAWEAGTPGPRTYERWQDRIIDGMIADGAGVLDLGCGDGELLERLITGKGVRGQGIELDPEAVCRCIERGVPVIQSDLDRGLRGLPEADFDVVILEETLQTLHKPAIVLAEMLRVGRRAIVSFPNFGWWRVRLDLALGGRMPRNEYLPHAWHDTPNIHLLTLQDLLDWSESEGVAIAEAHVLADGKVRPLRDDDNLLAEDVLIAFTRAED